MQDDYQSWDSIGKSIQDTIDRAVNSKDFQKLNQTISQVVERVNQASSGAEKPGPVPYAPQNRSHIPSKLKSHTTVSNPKNDSNLPAVYGYTGGKTTVGLVKTVFGGGITFFSALGALGSVLTAALLSDASILPSFFLFLAGTAAGSFLLKNGVSTLSRISRFKSYIRIIGEKTYCNLDQLARGVRKPMRLVKKDISRLIKEGLFLEGHLDHENNCLITTDETYSYYENCRHSIEESKQVNTPPQPAPEQKAASEVQDILDKGEAFLRQIHKTNLDIPGEEITKKISHMELLIARIFERVESHPEVAPDLKKLLDYYLPMTVKLLSAYAEMDRQPVQGPTIVASKQEIEKTLDTLNLAFEKLLDSIFKDAALDVSSDISVLHTLLAQEGLTEDDFEKLKKENNYQT